MIRLFTQCPRPPAVLRGWVCLLFGALCVPMLHASVGKPAVVRRKKRVRRKAKPKPRVVRGKRQAKPSHHRRVKRHDAPKLRVEEAQEAAPEESQTRGLLLWMVGLGVVAIIVYSMRDSDSLGNIIDTLHDFNPINAWSPNMPVGARPANFISRVQGLSQGELTEEIIRDYFAILNARRKDAYGGHVTDASSIKFQKFRVDNIIVVDHNNRSIAYQNILDLKDKVDIYFSKWQTLYNKDNGTTHTKERAYAQIAPLHCKVLECMTPNNPYYQNTQKLFDTSAYQSPSGTHAGNPTRFAFAQDLDNVTRSIVDHNANPHFKALYDKVYTQGDDLLTQDDKCLPGYSFETEMIQEVSAMCDIQDPQDLLDVFKKFKDNLNAMQYSRNGTVQAFNLAHAKKLITREHLLALYFYSAYGKIASHYTGLQMHNTSNQKNDLQRIKAIHVTLNDLMKRMYCIKNHPALGVLFPDFSAVVGGDDALVYRGLNIQRGPLVFGSFDGKAPTAMSASTSFRVSQGFSLPDDVDVNNVVQNRGYVVGLVPSGDNHIDMNWLSRYQGEKEVNITQGRFKMERIYLTSNV